MGLAYGVALIVRGVDCAVLIHTYGLPLQAEAVKAEKGSILCRPRKTVPCLGLVLECVNGLPLTVGCS